jgi:uncharacterized membrane protein
MVRRLDTYKMLLLSIGFTFMLLAVRVYKTDSITYIFYAPNLLLASLPLLFSELLMMQSKMNLKTWCILAMWLLFFPNAPYVVTDLFHYRQRPPAPMWFDLLIVASAAWNGLLLGIISLMQVEQFLTQHLKAKWVRLLTLMSLALCSYGVYIGRFLRFNSWNVVTHPTKLLYTTAHHVLLPWQHVMLWASSILFAAMFGVLYYTVKVLVNGHKSATLKAKTMQY